MSVGDAPGPAARQEAFPVLVRPMMAVLGTLPPDEAAWSAEIKWDGVRACAYVRGDAVRLVSRNDRDLAASYPDLAELSEVVGGRQVVLDGEIVAFDDAGRSSFEKLQARMHVRQPSAQLLAEVPVWYQVFDVLYADGWSTTRMPYTQRRELLEQLGLSGDRVGVPPAFPGTAGALLAASREQRLEGIIVKRLDSPYLPDKRSPLWTKVKNLSTQEVLIGGWKPGKGRRADMIGSLLLGIPASGGLSYVGNVGTGFTEAMLRELGDRLTLLQRTTSPFTSPVPPAEAAQAKWVEPTLVGEVAFAEWTGDGRMRHPAWRGLRPDKTPDQVVRES